MKRIMSNSIDLKNKITNWLLEEGISVNQIPDTVNEFRLRINNAGYFLDILKEKESKRLICYGTISFHENTVKALSKLNKKGKADFLNALHLELTKLKPGYSFQSSDNENISTVTIDQLVYLEDLTKTLLMDALISVRKSLHLVNIFSISKLDIDFSVPSGTTENKLPGMG